ncbi:hypothetical protein R1T40_00410 (plasmid) [Tritonibacter scottomollicae]|uniref:DUF4175 domain-containing protein n=1 Tax=Tritonibacter scottomollicae TaxID=483013 RepID=A0ABZ0HB93_TRISK|nr:hypothetical protein [Tritonibacter scottomollicae]WOI31336.1 hypothetical protein R1T40_00410 [Tritonibacter scottomollicae]
MKYGWRFVFIPLWVLCISGAALTAFLVADWLAWQAFAVAITIGLIVGVPAGIWTTFKVRRDDPAWS